MCTTRTIWHLACAVLAVCLVSGSVQAGMSQATISPPGGFAQAGAYSSSPGSSIWPGADLLSFFPSGADLHEQSFAGNSSATATASFSGSGVTNATSAQAGMGIIHLSASNDAPNNSSFARAASNAGWNETLNISDPTLNGQPGFMLVDILVNGTLQAAGFAGSAGFDVTGYKDHTQLNIYNGAGAYFNKGNSDGISTDRQAAVWGVATYGYEWNFASRTVNDAITLAVPITYGQSFTLGIYAYASAGMRSASGVPGNSSTSLDFSHTLTWGGIPAVFYNGTPVTDYTLTSGTGIDWTQPVPEPATLALLLAGVIPALARRRARRPV
jgi:hypothetical protein